MSKRKDEVPRRLMTKVRRQVGRETMRHKPKTIYNRNKVKQETLDIIDHECTCLRMVCECILWEEEYELDT